VTSASPSVLIDGDSAEDLIDVTLARGYHICWMRTDEENFIVGLAFVYLFTHDSRSLRHGCKFWTSDFRLAGGMFRPFARPYGLEWSVSRKCGDGKARCGDSRKAIPGAPCFYRAVYRPVNIESSNHPQ
jgi:hypothetical protein